MLENIRHCYGFIYWIVHPDSEGSYLRILQRTNATLKSRDDVNTCFITSGITMPWGQ